MARRSDATEAAIHCTTEAIAVATYALDLVDAVRSFYGPSGYLAYEVSRRMDRIQTALDAGDREAARTACAGAQKLQRSVCAGLNEAEARFKLFSPLLRRTKARLKRQNGLMTAGIPYPAAEDLVA